MSKAIKELLECLKSALGADANYFNIELSEVLVDDDELFSMTVLIEPKKNAFSTLRYKVYVRKSYLEVCIIDNNKVLMIGEDIEVEISYGNIYAQLFWSEILSEN